MAESVSNSFQTMEHYWTITNFNKYFDFIDDNRSVTASSEEFKINNCDDYQFFFKLTISSKSILCSLYRSNTTKFSHMSLKLYFSTWNIIKNRNWGIQHFMIDYNEDSSKVLATIEYQPADLSQPEKRQSLFPRNKLMITSELTTLYSFAEIQPPYTPKPFQSMNDHFRELLKSGSGSDVILEVDGKEFKAHKSILLARSPVFAAMFHHDMIENRTNRVVIEDISEATFKLLLEFIYPDEIKTKLDVEMGLLLLQAAGKYQLDGLQTVCESQIIKLIKKDNEENIRAVVKALSLTNFFKSIDAFAKLN